MKVWLPLLLIAALSALVVTFTGLLVVPPIGALPEGATVLIWRLNTMNFIDSPDAWCERQTGGVSLLCRASVLAKVANEDAIIARFPYSEALYLWSTGGHAYSN